MKREYIALLDMLHGLAEEAVVSRRTNPDADDTDTVAALHQDTLDQSRVLIDALKNEYAYPQFMAMLSAYDNKHVSKKRTPYRDAHRALTVAWWFIENVPEDAPDRQDAFFTVRSIVREAL